MERLRRLFTNRYLLLWLILLVSALNAGWQVTLTGRREYFGRLADYYTRKAQQGSPSSVARYSALARKYRDAYRRPWTLRPPKAPEF
jgi:hypothetical protein